MTTTTVFCHGAFAESSSWDDVLAHLPPRVGPTIAFANPLRAVAADAAALTTAR